MWSWARLPEIFSMSALLLHALEPDSPPLIARAFSQGGFKDRKKPNQRQLWNHVVYTVAVHTRAYLRHSHICTQKVSFYQVLKQLETGNHFKWRWSWMVDWGVRCDRAANGWDHYLAITLTHSPQSHHTSSEGTSHQPSSLSEIIPYISTSHLLTVISSFSSTSTNLIFLTQWKLMCSYQQSRSHFSLTCNVRPLHYGLRPIESVQ